ncbi:hypothetical protein B4U80_11708 [Leptotrombidium deliense]|uniref:Uncharacterized protein n=1 Tax=Leptotrombidium deliense TaxID=299467 RepID=A0A443S3M7_9ACAR|nr:hypothetical protein B4U80_11708 [Leptotrombidium deliense]
MYDCVHLTSFHVDSLVGSLQRLREFTFIRRGQSTGEDMAPVVMQVLKKNTGIANLALQSSLERDFLIRIPQESEPLVSLWYDVQNMPKRHFAKIWNSVLLKSDQSLQELSTWVREERLCPILLKFQNLRDLRLSFTVEMPPNFVASFNNLEVLKLMSEAPRQNAEVIPELLGRQHDSLRVLEIGVNFYDEGPLQQICQLCPNLQILIFRRFCCYFEEMSAQSLVTLKNLEQLWIMIDARTAYLYDEYLAMVVQNLPALRVLQADQIAGRASGGQQTYAALLEKATANPNQVYFYNIGTMFRQSTANLKHITEESSDLFGADDFRYDYFMWKKLNSI